MHLCAALIVANSCNEFKEFFQSTERQLQRQSIQKTFFEIFSLSLEMSKRKLKKKQRPRRFPTTPDFYILYDYISSILTCTGEVADGRGEGAVCIDPSGELLSIRAGGRMLL